MSLRNKIAFAVSLAVSSMFFIDHALQVWNLSQRFETEADEMASEGIGHIVELIEGEVELLAEGVERLGSTIAGRRIEHLRGLEFLTRSGAFDVLLMFDTDGVVQHHRVLDPIGHELLMLEELPSDQLPEAHPLREAMRMGDREGSVEGLIPSVRGPVLIACRTVVLAGGEPMRIAAGRFLSPNWLKQFQGDGAPVSMQLLEGDSLPKETQELVNRLAESSKGRVVVKDGDKRMAWGWFYDLGGEPAFLIGQAQTGPLVAIGSDIQWYSALSALVCGLLCSLILLWFLRGSVMRPLGELMEQSKAIARDSATSNRLEMGRSDEFGQLANAFDSMMDLLAGSRADVLQVARKAGASDIATAVLLNVGSSLNSVGIAARLSHEKLVGLPLEDLEVIALVLKANEHDLHSYLTQDERGKALPAYMEALSEKMHSETDHLGDELSELLRGIAGIQNLVATLEQAGGVGSLTDRLNLSELLDSILEISGTFMKHEQSVKIRREYLCPGRVNVDRHKLSEVLLHVLRASLLQPMEGRDLEVCVALGMASNGRIAISVSDNGWGLTRGELATVFAMDPALDDKTGRSGLHLAATSAQEMGAELTAESKGLDRGTCFRLVLPAACQAA
ncbi:MAG: HAMP domain-containing protein [Planctomycetota bacterium]|nr:HAMP domain-containing protein [Planctomycetota bacterium]